MAQPKAIIVTTKGTIEAELWSADAPEHVANLKKLADAKFYDGLIFHRVIPGFMVQAGCPQGTGTGGPGWKVKAEFNKRPFKKGVLGMARSADPNSAGSQFFICVADAAHLTGQYTAFGAVTSGQDIADAIANAKRDHRDKPEEAIKITSFTVLEV